MIILIRNLRRNSSRRQAQVLPTSGGLAAAAAAVVITVPAHGFIVNSGILMHSTAVHTQQESSVAGWMQTFFGACAWAFMIAAGSLVYNHFVGKWQEKGYPILPVAALTAADSIPRLRGSSAIPLHEKTTSNQTSIYDRVDEPHLSHMDWMDQYEG